MLTSVRYQALSRLPRGQERPSECEYWPRDGSCEIALGLESAEGNAPPGQGKEKTMGQLGELQAQGTPMNGAKSWESIFSVNPMKMNPIALC